MDRLRRVFFQEEMNLRVVDVSSVRLNNMKGKCTIICLGCLSIKREWRKRS